MEGLPASHVLVDLDCDALGLPKTGQRSDYVYVDEDTDSSRVATIELKGGGFNSRAVLGQLQGGADIASKWLPSGRSFRLVPVLVHGKGIRKPDRKALRATKIRLRDREAQAVLIHCRAPLKSALERA